MFHLIIGLRLKNFPGSPKWLKNISQSLPLSIRHRLLPISAAAPPPAAETCSIMSLSADPPARLVFLPRNWRKQLAIPACFESTATSSPCFRKLRKCGAYLCVPMDSGPSSGTLLRFSGILRLAKFQVAGTHTMTSSKKLLRLPHPNNWSVCNIFRSILSKVRVKNLVWVLSLWACDSLGLKIWYRF